MPRIRTVYPRARPSFRPPSVIPDSDRGPSGAARLPRIRTSKANKDKHHPPSVSVKAETQTGRHWNHRKNEPPPPGTLTTRRRVPSTNGAPTTPRPASTCAAPHCQGAALPDGTCRGLCSTTPISPGPICPARTSPKPASSGRTSKAQKCETPYSTARRWWAPTCGTPI